MKTRVKFFILALALFSQSVFSSEGASKVVFRTGELPLLGYIEMVSEVMGLQVNATSVDESEKGKVVVRSSVPIEREQAMNSFISALASRGYSPIYDADLDTYRIVRQRDARDENLPVITNVKDLADNDLPVTTIQQLRYFPPDGMTRTLRSFGPANSRLISDAPSHSILITDSARNIQKYGAMIARLDTKKGGEEAKAYLERARSEKTNSSECGRAVSADASGPSSLLILVLFSLVGVIVGFLIRGYVIRKIEGGL